jgi:hypothetical protein
MKKPIVQIAALGLLVPLAACTSVSSRYTGAITVAEPERIYVCHGFDCYYKTRYDVTYADFDRFARIMAQGTSSPEAERAAISSANMYFETRAAKAVGVADKAKSSFGKSGEKGQMDCIDESTNTRSFLLFLARNGWLKHHDVLMNESRGAFVDGRYPHSTAVLREHATGEKWAVDSWYEDAGGPPDIMRMADWRKRGVLGER